MTALVVFEDPVLAVALVAVAIATMLFFVGAMYLGGGNAAIRRQIPQLGLVAGTLGVMVVAVPLLMRGLGDLASGLIILGLNAAVLIAWRFQSRPGEGPLDREKWSRAFRVPGFRTLIAVYVAFIIGWTLLVMIAASARS